MSFTKKINTFLSDAKTNDVINDDTYQKLQNFAKNYGSKSINSFVNIVGFFGGLAIILGLILIISHNWSEIPNVVKISVYVATLIGFHFLAYQLRNNYPKISHILHFIGAGYVIAGIGLIAQIYHLSSEDGRAFLMWFLMILPLALILKHRWIGVMVMFSFYVWVDINANSNYYHFLNNIKSLIIYFTAVSTSMILLPRVIGLVNNCFDHIRFFGTGLLMTIVLAMGFGHEILPNKAEEISLHPITIAILIFNLLALIYILLQNQKRDTDSLLPEKHISIMLIILGVLPFLISDESTKIILSILYWAIWFYFSGIMIYQGDIRENKFMINIGTWCVMIGIIARFIDIIGTMLFTGSMFILFGTILIAVAFAGEKYRKHLINKISHINVN